MSSLRRWLPLVAESGNVAGAPGTGDGAGYDVRVIDPKPPLQEQAEWADVDMLDQDSVTDALKNSTDTETVTEALPYALPGSR